MGNDNDLNLKEEIFNQYISLINDRIQEYIEKSYCKTKFSNMNDMQVWKDNIKKYINNLLKPNYELFIKLKEFYKEIYDTKNEEKYKSKGTNQNFIYTKYNQIKTEEEDIYQNINRNIIKTNNVFMSKDAQNKLSKIIDAFKIYSVIFFNDNDEIENKTIGEFLYKIANISRISYNHSNELLSKIYDDFSKKNEANETIISSLDQFKEEFSTWVKNNEDYVNNKIEIYIKDKNINKIITYISEEKDEKTKRYFISLYKELQTLYIICELSFPSIKIDFNINDNEFNSEKMIDFAHNKGKKKTNLVFFPSFFSNGNYLENGKQWVFTYIDDDVKKRTFYFKDVKLEPLIEDKTKFHIPKLSEKLRLNIEKENCYLKAITNYKIKENVKKQYRYYLINRKTKNEREISTGESSIKIEENEDCSKCELFLMSEYI